MFLLVPAHPGSPGHRTVNRLCVRVRVCSYNFFAQTGMFNVSDVHR